MSNSAQVPANAEDSFVDPYAFNPGYYDLLRAKAGKQALPSVGFFAELAPQAGHALEIGPGTGRVTLAVAERVASLYCLERSPTMRAVLIAKIAGYPQLWPKITVLEAAAPSFHLGRRFDYAYLAGVLEHVPADQRPVLFRALADHLVEGGVLAMDMVLKEPAPNHPDQLVDEISLGDCRYTLSAAAQALRPNLSHLRMTYRTYHRGQLVAIETSERLHNLHRPDEVLADLAAVGLTPIDGDGIAMATNDPADPGAVVVRRSLGP